MVSPKATDDEEILDAVEQLVEAGERDRMEGGVRAERVAEELPIATTTVQDRLADLHDQGHLVRVWGAQPDPPYEPRVSYLPADHPDAEPPEY